MSAEFVKAAMQPVDDHPTLPNDRLRKGDVSIMTMDTISIVPEVLQKGVMMTKILAKQQKRLMRAAFSINRLNTVLVSY
jgi:hypothetical protein